MRWIVTRAEVAAGVCGFDPVALYHLQLSNDAARHTPELGLLHESINGLLRIG